MYTYLSDRRVHTESVKHWLEHLEKDPVHVLVCLTHADQLYVEYMNEDGTHKPSDNVRREIKIQLDVSWNYLLIVTHVQWNLQ